MLLSGERVRLIVWREESVSECLEACLEVRSKAPTLGAQPMASDVHLTGAYILQSFTHLPGHTGAYAPVTMESGRGRAAKAKGDIDEKISGDRCGSSHVPWKDLQKVEQHIVNDERTDRGDEDDDDLADWERDHPYFQAQRAARSAAAARSRNVATVSQSTSEVTIAPVDLGALGEKIARYMIEFAIEKVVFNAIEQCAHAEPRHKSNWVPDELMGRRLDPNLAWRVLPAASRHWLKRRIGTYKREKLTDKLMDFAVQRVQERLVLSGMGHFNADIIHLVMSTHLGTIDEQGWADVGKRRGRLRSGPALRQ